MPQDRDRNEKKEDREKQKKKKKKSSPLVAAQCDRNSSIKKFLDGCGAVHLISIYLSI